MKRFQLPDPKRRRLLRSALASTVLAAGAVGLGITVRANAQSVQASEWKVGMLRSDGLRIIPGGRSDASRVLNPNRFSRPEVRHAYWVATQIPATLNQLYCWCGCENRGAHRSNLQCFEDEMAVNCEVCRGTAEIAYTLVQKGVTDAARIQSAVDAKWAPKA
ncbi:MAG TPA: PCYCGC motif-containing (lipo)protein [Burkholderiales bacterium]|jgi:hypothetical protein|nr:PCYCGC motif-containing (lipo)protein [Burkholderiales bacterium]